ncbi:MAG: AAA family ATPase [Nitrososphaeraceae archaeon]
MVFIKKVEIYGFKSFGFKNTVINLNNGLIAVTGPNGSGKSNVLDAIMFALGENSPKALRVDKFQSLFHDTQNKSHKLVRVSITFDNQNRGIPIDSDNITLTREMEGSVGESEYHLNGKKVTKSTIIELLQIVVAVPNKLNIVQQGMITRISELNAEERRKIIEDIVGLSYFDEKKEESLKQLEESDRRLDIALARMNEIRKRIDDLEVERNEQLRFQHIERYIKKYNAIKISNESRNTKRNIMTNEKELETKRIKYNDLSLELKKTKQELETIDLEKMNFIKEVDLINKEKAQISNKVSLIVYHVEKSKAIYKETISRIEEIDKKIERGDIAGKESNIKVKGFQDEIAFFEKKGETINKRKVSYTSELKNLDNYILQLSTKNQKIELHKRKINYRYEKILSLNNKFEVDILKIKENLKIIINNKIETNSKIKKLKSKVLLISQELQNNVTNVIDVKRRTGYISKLILEIEKKIKEFNNEIEESKIILNKSDTEALRFYEKDKILTETMAEDLTISEISNEKELHVVGIVHDLVKWDKNYLRPIMAVGSEWLKAIVVNNVEDMVKIAEFAKVNNLPRVKIIPLDIIQLSEKVEVYEEDISFIGNLANFIDSDYKKLIDFIFGNIIVVRTASEAYKLSLKGYRSVSIDGEFFDAKSNMLLVDYNSAVINFVTEINLKNNFENLRILILKLKNLLLEKTTELRNLIDKLKNLQFEKIELENNIRYIEDKVIIQRNILQEHSVELKELELVKSKNESDYTNTVTLLKTNRKRFSLIADTKKKIEEDLKRINLSFEETKIANLNLERSKYQKMLELDNQELQDIVIHLSEKKNERDLLLERINSLNEERRILLKEQSDKEILKSGLEHNIEKEEQELKFLRNKEQNIIFSSGDTYALLQSYEEKIKILLDHERKLSRENSSLEREIVLLEKETSNLKQHEVKLNNDLMWLGYKELNEDNFDVDDIVFHLSEEYEILKSKINLRADENYIQIVNGYRGMSHRKNDLEKERNSIVVFIEEINKEKKNLFMDAFIKINKDINFIFSRIIGGNAWLEIENPEDIFSKGVRLTVQFPQKPRRDSTALSGGEKTMAATIFLLALQAIKPSPFYLMDEVDAHLDAENNERLSKILFERSKHNQIIMVTLKDSTISKVDQIYGVFPREGVSHIIKYKYHKKELDEISLN